MFLVLYRHAYHVCSLGATLVVAGLNNHCLVMFGICLSDIIMPMPQTYGGSSWASFQTLQTDKARCPEGIEQMDTNGQFPARRVTVIRSNPSMRTRGVQVRAFFFYLFLNFEWIMACLCKAVSLQVALRTFQVSSPQNMPNASPSRSSGRLFCEDGATACSRHVSRWSAWSWGSACSRLATEGTKRKKASNSLDVAFYHILSSKPSFPQPHQAP